MVGGSVRGFPGPGELPSLTIRTQEGHTMPSPSSPQQVPDRASDGSSDDPAGRPNGGAAHPNGGADRHRDPVTGRAAHATGERQAAENEDRDLPG